MNNLFDNTGVPFSGMKLVQLSVSKSHVFLYLEEVSLFSQSFIINTRNNVLLNFMGSWEDQVTLVTEEPHPLDSLSLIPFLPWSILEKKKKNSYSALILTDLFPIHKFIFLALFSLLHFSQSFFTPTHFCLITQMFYLTLLARSIIQEK